MVRIVSIIFFVFLGGTVGFSQAWKDSLQKANQLYQSEEFEKSFETFLETQRIAPNDVNLSADIGVAAYRKGDYDMAEKAFTAATNKEGSAEELAQYWHNIGNSQIKKKDFDGALESYKNALRINPKDEKARYNLASLKRQMQQQEEQEQNQQQNQQRREKKKANEEVDQEESNGESQLQQGDDAENQPQEMNAPQQEMLEDNDSESKLTQRKMDRMMDDLLKDEMQTKKRLRELEMRREGEGIKSGKRW